jgi:hypothetical protein
LSGEEKGAEILEAVKLIRTVTESSLPDCFEVSRKKNIKKMIRVVNLTYYRRV